MQQAAFPLLASWTNFYVIVGSSAGALTGLQFVVMTLIAGAQVESNMREVRAFGTPTVVHFCMALLISALINAPWPTPFLLGLYLAACGTAGIAYTMTVIRHARKAAYNPDTEDWIWYAVLPCIAHTALTAAAILLWWHPVAALFAIAAITLLFLFVGIHNSWDTVTYIAVRKRQDGKPEGPNGS